jgi:hypothetical protein
VATHGRAVDGPAARSRRAGTGPGMSRLRRPAVALVSCAAAALAACAAPPAAPSAPQQSATPVGAQFFGGPETIWHTPVPPDAPADPRSAEFVARMAELDPVIAVRSYTAPIYRAGDDSPTYRIEPTAPYATPEAVLDKVPIPDHAHPDPAGDAHMAILDERTDCVFELYRAQRTPEGWTAEWINATPADGDGIYPDGLSTRASGISITAGLIWPEELRSGHIDHALVFAYPFTSRSGPVPPATRSDGRTDEPTALPIGARVVLDPALDLTTLALTPTELMVAEALQKYGMILADSGGGLSLFAVHPQSYPADPYAAFWGPTNFASLSGLPVDRFKVLELSLPQPPYFGPVTPNRCSDAAQGW